MSGTATLTRLECAYLVPAEERNPAGVASRLDSVVRDRLEERCRAALSAVLDAADPSVWVIRHLDVGVTLPLALGASDDRDAVADIWAQRIAERIVGVVSGAVSLPVGDVVRFADRAAYLASFAADLAQGRAAGNWTYEDFAGLWSLPPGRAVVTAAQGLDVPVTEVVRHLARSGRLTRVLAALDASDAATLWSACEQEAHGGPAEPALVRALLGPAAAWAPAPTRALAALRLLGAELAATTSSSSVAPLVAAVAAAVRTVRRERRATGGGFLPPPPSERGPAADTVTASDEPAVPGPGPGVDGEPVVPSAQPRAQSLPPRTAPQAFASPYAGLLRVLPSLLAAGLHDAATGSTGDARSAAARRHQVLLRCLGRRAGPFAAHDPGLLLLAGAEGRDTGPWPTPAGDRLLSRALAALAAGGRVDSAVVGLTTLRNPAGPGSVLLLRAVASDLWLFCGTDRGERTTARALSLVAAAGLPVAQLVDDGNSPARDLDFLGAARPGAVSVLAQAGIRLFSRRLIGFGSAAAGHLVPNALSAPGSVTVLPDRIDVLVEPTPLQVVLDLAGLDRLSCFVPWLDVELTIRTVGGCG